MQYITTTELAELPGAQELAQVATAAHQPVVAVELMEATLRETDRSGFDAADIALADDALARIAEAVEQAEGLIDGHLVKRGYAVPLNPVPKLVTGWARDIARYYLHKDLSADDTGSITRGYKDANKMLGLIVDGKFSLGGTDPVETAPNKLDVRFDYDRKTFSRRELNSFR
ncbi:gp436 family protein [Gilvimarinus agarilyticus]|uniref:gp436 family protein n=1 Tax=Gilvimarinus agarilyticus TaxID=679259 RepID=UPI00059FFB67|nr:DUF1320 domain-containing protein [Gilvimarinus agarilyticus]